MARPVQLPRGLWKQGRIFYADLTDAAGKRRRFTLKTDDLATAEKLLKRERDRLVHGIDPPVADITCSRFLAQYLGETALRRGKGWQEKTRLQLERFFAFASVPLLRQLHAQHLKDFAKTRISAGMTTTTVMHDAQIIRSAIRWAVANGLLKADPFAGVAGLPRRMRHMLVRYLTEAQREALILAADGPVTWKTKNGHEASRKRRTPLGAIVAVGVYAGLRAEEILRLSWDRIDWDRREIRVQAVGEWRPKTREERTVPLFPPLASILEPLRRKAGLLFATTSRRKPGEPERPYSVRNIDRDLQLVAKAHKIQPVGGGQVGFVVLRHTFATALVSRGVPIFAVSKWLGHESVKTTERHYAAFAPASTLLEQAGAALLPGPPPRPPPA